MEKRSCPDAAASIAPATKRCRPDAVAVVREGEEEVPVHTQILSLASPVFDAMFESGMDESSSRRFTVDGTTKVHFVEFYSCLMPGANLAALITEANVESVLQLADYYQVQFVKAACAQVYEKLAITPQRLLNAHKYGLVELTNTWCAQISQVPVRVDLSVFKGNADLLLNIAVHMQKGGKEVASDADFKDKLQQCCNYVGRMAGGSCKLYKKLDDCLNIPIRGVD